MKISRRWIFVVFLSILIRLPRHFGIFGIDGLFLLWEARRLLDGSLFETMIHPTSYLGMYPFSGYPIGSIIITAFFLIISFQNIYVAIILYNITMISLMITFAKYYFKYVFDNDIVAYLAAFLFVNSSPIFQFSYTNVSARLPFMVIYPLIILTLTKLVMEPNRIELRNLILLSILSLTFHRMSMVVLAIIIPATIYIALEKLFPEFMDTIIDKIISQQWMLALYLIIVGFFSFVTARVLNIPYRHFRSPFGFDSPFLDYLFIIPSQLYQNFGLLILMSFLSIWLFMKKKASLNKIKIVSIVIQSSLILLLANLIYIFYLIIPLIVLLSSIFLEYGLEELDFFKISVVGMAVILWLGQLMIMVFLVDLILQFVVSSLIAIGSIIALSKIDLHQYDMRYLYNPILIIIILLMSMNSVFMLDFSINYNKGEAPYRTGEISTPEEAELAEWFKSQPQATVWGYSRLLTARVALFADWLLFDDLHGISIVIEDYYTEEQLENSELKPPYKWWEAYVYEVPYNWSRDIHAQIMVEYDMDDPEFHNNITIANVPYFIGYSDSNMTETYGGVWEESPLIQSFIENNVDIVHSVDNYVIYDLRPYFN